MSMVLHKSELYNLKVNQSDNHKIVLAGRNDESIIYVNQ